MTRWVALSMLAIVFLLQSCASLKIGLFRSAMEAFGGRVYRNQFIALTDPKFIPASEAGYLRPDEEVIGVYYNGEAKAYPLTMAFHHHIFNDEVGGRRMLVTFCPLTHTAMVYDPVTAGADTLAFVVEGGLVESNMVMEDKLTRSRWVQVPGEAIGGKMRGEKLDLLPGLHTTWRIWKRLFPNTLVLSRDTGFDRDYSRFPFQEKYFKYKKSSRFLFEVSRQDDRYHPKEIVLVVQVGGRYKIYPFSALKGSGALNDSLAQTPYVVFFDTTSQTVAAYSRRVGDRVLEFSPRADSSGTYFKDAVIGSTWDFAGRAVSGPWRGRTLQPMKFFKAFWFAAIVFHPDAVVYGEPRT